MHPRERVLGVALLAKRKGEQVPLDVLAELDRYGLDVSEFCEPPTTIEQPLITDEESERLYDENTERDIQY